MKQFFFVIILILSFQLNAQDCDIDNWIDSVYSFDASILALREIDSDTNHEFADSVIIPDTLINKYLKLFSSVYSLKTNTTDSIFIYNKIHVFPNISYNSLFMKIDTNYSWIKTYLQDSLISGNYTFDSITSLYNFKLDEYWLNFTSFRAIIIKTKSILNVPALVPLFQQIDGLYDIIGYCYCEGDGDNIEVNFINDTAKISFSAGWGDCPAGCMNRHYWEFSVKECQAKFEGSFGDPFPLINNEISNEIKVYPNPVSDKLYLFNNSMGKSYIQIYDLSGNIISQFESVSREIDFIGFKSGIYILRMIHDNKTDVIKIIKR